MRGRLGLWSIRLTRLFFDPYGHFRLRLVVSHISRKTSEIWGTLGFVDGLKG
jgi:hypothetical protein